MPAVIPKVPSLGNLVSVDWGNPINQKIRYLCAPGISPFPIDLISRVKSTLTGGIKILTANGPGLQSYSGTSAESNSLNITSGPFTIWAAVYITNAESAYQGIFSRFSYTSESINSGYGIETDNALHYRFLVGGNNGSASYDCASPTGYANTPGDSPGYSTVAGTSNGSIRSLLVEGVVKQTASTNLSPLTNTTAGVVAVNGATQRNSILVSAIWARALSGAELVSLSQNPWQLFKATTSPRKLFIGTAVSSEVTVASWHQPLSQRTPPIIQVVSY